VQNLRGVALYRIGNADAAFEAFKKAVQLDGKNQKARLNLAAHYAFYGFNEKAKSEFSQAGGSFVVRGDAGEHPELGALSKFASGGGKK
jgi:Flp pilus assembly protein TadD